MRLSCSLPQREGSHSQPVLVIGAAGGTIIPTAIAQGMSHSITRATVWYPDTSTSRSVPFFGASQHVKGLGARRRILAYGWVFSPPLPSSPSPLKLPLECFHLKRSCPVLLKPADFITSLFQTQYLWKVSHLHLSLNRLALHMYFLL